MQGKRKILETKIKNNYDSVLAHSLFVNKHFLLFGNRNEEVI